MQGPGRVHRASGEWGSVGSLPRREVHVYKKGPDWAAPGAGHSLFPMLSAEKQRELARKGSLKSGSMGSPVNQQPKKNNVMARTR